MIPTYMFLFIGILLALVIGGAGTMLRNYVETSREQHSIK